MENNMVTKAKTSWPSLFDNDWVEKFFNAPLDEFFTTKIINVPAVNVNEKDKEYLLTVAAPGLRKEDINVEVDDNIMTIRAEKENEEKEEKNGRYNRREYNYSSWSRSFALPEDSFGSKINAEYKNGELVINIPKSEVKGTKNVKSIEIH
jgi:HSP20 family protein